MKRFGIVMLFVGICAQRSIADEDIATLRADTARLYKTWQAAEQKLAASEQRVMELDAAHAAAMQREAAAKVAYDNIVAEAGTAAPGAPIPKVPPPPPTPMMTAAAAAIPLFQLKWDNAKAVTQRAHTALQAAIADRDAKLAAAGRAKSAWAAKSAVLTANARVESLERKLADEVRAREATDRELAALKDKQAADVAAQLRENAAIRAEAARQYAALDEKISQARRDMTSYVDNKLEGVRLTREADARLLAELLDRIEAVKKTAVDEKRLQEVQRVFDEKIAALPKAYVSAGTYTPHTLPCGGTPAFYGVRHTPGGYTPMGYTRMPTGP